MVLTRSQRIKKRKREEYIENKINNELIDLATNCGYNQYRITQIVKNDGNSLFKSILIASNKYPSNMTLEFREEIADIFIQFRYKKYLNKYNKTLEKVFKDYNYDELVKNIREPNNKLNIEINLLLEVISKFYQLNFIIINSESTEPTEINTYEYINILDIPLGYLNEDHYIPLEKIS